MTDFSTQQVKMFKKLFAHPPLAKGLGIPEKVLLQFVLFEALVRLAGGYYRERITQKKKSNAHPPFDISVVWRSFEYFCISVSRERLGLLLDSSLTKRNAKSARNLRNGLVHQGTPRVRTCFLRQPRPARVAGGQVGQPCSKL